MEFTDTMPYDGDEAAWQGWQVAAPTEPVPAMGVPAETQLEEEEEADPNAAAPTLAYDTAGEFVANVEQKEEDEVDPTAVAPTLAYDTAGEFVVNETQQCVAGGNNDTLAYEVHSPGGIPHLARRAAAAGLPPRFMPSPLRLQAEELAQTQEVAQTEQVLGLERAQTQVVSEREQELERPSPLPPARTRIGTGRISCSGLVKRLVGKQAPPPGYVSAGPAPRRQTLPAARRRRRQEAGDAAASGIGCKIRVKGDGWGGGGGEYEGTVTQADELSFTVIFRNDNKKWEETHVLRRYCDIVEHVEAPSTHRRRTT
eukprot:TRINITY_DN29720_c0_g1_i1.p1 TRINITY_DN29720_c0_g1~~TRINITY_DN29720_c0_g1_i1.p1  ORF type:complete len:313 (+),score=70.44 TRINITY_DN29720_c0_g1_i1:78-1016(+)